MAFVVTDGGDMNTPPIHDESFALTERVAKVPAYTPPMATQNYQAPEDEKSDNPENSSTYELDGIIHVYEDKEQTYSDMDNTYQVIRAVTPTGVWEWDMAGDCWRRLNKENFGASF